MTCKQLNKYSNEERKSRLALFVVYGLHVFH